jgi:hypothetical protein
MKYVFAFVLSLLSTVSFASQGGEGNNTGCNGVGNANSPCANGQGSTTVNPTVSPTINPTINPTFSTNSTNVNGNSNVNRATGGTGIGIGGNGGAGGNASQSQGQGQTQQANGGIGVASSTATSQASNAGNNQSVNISSPSNLTVRSVGIAPDVIGSATAACRIAVGASAGWVGAAFGFNASVLDEGCDTREDARFLVNMGKSAAAVRRLCAKPEMAKALGAEDCPQEQEPVVVKY